MPDKSVEPQDKENILSPKPVIEDRRLVLKASLATGTILSSAQWAKPIINAVVLPAHAQTSDECDALTVSFSASQFEFDSDDDNEDMKMATMQVTNTSAFSVSLSGSVTPSSKGETYSVTFDPNVLDLGESGDITVSVDFSGLSTFCGGFDNTQALVVTATPDVELSCEPINIPSVPVISIIFGC